MGNESKNNGKNGKKLSALLEALLFVASTPISINELSQNLGLPNSEIQKSLNELEDYYRDNRYLCLQWHKNKVRLITAPEISEQIESFLKIEITTTLSRAALEAIAIIALKQPTTRPEVDEVRGVNSDGVIRTLLSKGLIQELGRADGLGRPILYGTTDEFLLQFGLTSLDQIPSFDVLPGINNDQKDPNSILKG